MRDIKFKNTVRNIKIPDKAIKQHIKNASINMKNRNGQLPYESNENPNEYAMNRISESANEIRQNTTHLIINQGKHVIKTIKTRFHKFKTIDADTNVPTDIPQKVKQLHAAEKSKKIINKDVKEKAHIHTGDKKLSLYISKAGNTTKSPNFEMINRAVPYSAENIRKKAIHPCSNAIKNATVKEKSKCIKYSIKTKNAAIKISANTIRQTEKGVKISAAATPKAILTGRKSSKKATQRTVYIAKSTINSTLKIINFSFKAMTTTVKTGISFIFAGGWIVLLIILIVVLFAGILSLNTDNDSTSTNPISEEVKAYAPLITEYAAKHEIPGYVELIKAVMMQESGGKGGDPMQASACPFNTKYPQTPNGIKKADYSIDVGIQNLAACLKAAEAKNPIDMAHIKTALQGYNYGSGYIAWAIKNYGGYTTANAIEFSEKMKKELGWDSYGDTLYVSHVLQYYPISDMPVGTGSQTLVQIALTQEGNKGGKLYWSWYGFKSRVSWCACFVSWCADQCGLIKKGIIPKFSLCSDGADWFKEKKQWREKNYVPAPGDIIFFDREKTGVTHHVGIVVNVSDDTVNTIEGNSSDICRKRSYSLSEDTIMGYGVLSTS